MNMKSMEEMINNPDSHLVDVRTPHEVDEVSVDRAENIPLDTVPHNIDRFRKMEKSGGDIVLFCRSGARSEQAMRFLRSHGIQNVVNAGGYADVQSKLK